MRLAFLHMSPEWDGHARVFATVARSLGERGHECFLVAPSGSEAAMQAVERGVRVLAFPPGQGAWRVSRTLRALLPPDFADAVFVHSDEEQLTAALAVRAARRGQVVRRVGAGEELVQGWRGVRAGKLAATRMLYTTDSPPSSIAAPSGTLPGVRAEIGVGIPQEAPGTVRFVVGASSLLLVATRHTLRRATNVMRATALLAQRHPNLRLRVLGSVAYEQDLKLLAAALGMGRRVDWLGYADGPAAYLGSIAGWVIADGDDAATATLDVMAHGVAVMAERTTVAARYVSDGIHGVTMAKLDPALMAAELAPLIAEPEVRIAMGTAARLRVEREFPLREMLAGFEQAARSARERVAVRA